MTNVKAFTLIEVLVVLLIIGILTAVAVPVYTAMTDGAQVNDRMNQLAQSIKLAKSIAKRERVSVIVCASTDGSSCMAAGAEVWTNGWIVRTDPTPPNPSELRAVQDAIVGMVVTDHVTVGTPDRLRLLPSGLMENNANVVRRIEFSRGTSRGCLQLSAVGRVSLAKVACF